MQLPFSGTECEPALKVSLRRHMTNLAVTFADMRVNPFYGR